MALCLFMTKRFPLWTWWRHRQPRMYEGSPCLGCRFDFNSVDRGFPRDRRWYTHQAARNLLGKTDKLKWRHPRNIVVILAVSVAHPTLSASPNNQWHSLASKLTLLIQRCQLHSPNNQWHSWCR